MKIIETVSNLLVKWFNLLRVKSPVIAAALQVILAFVAGYFGTHEVIVTPEWLKEVLSYVLIKDLNWLVVGVLAAVITGINTPLTEKVAKLKAEEAAKKA